MKDLNNFLSENEVDTSKPHVAREGDVSKNARIAGAYI